MTSRALIQSFDQRVVVPTLAVLGSIDDRLSRLPARQLLVMTAVREGDGLRAVQQYGGGPARSLFGLEPNTVHSLLDREIRSDWVAKILARLILHPPFDLTPAGSDALLEHLTWNPWLACAVARLKYWTVPKALPAAGAWRDLAAYWKQWFNTAAGAGTVEKFLASNAATIEYFEFIRRGQA